MEKHLYEIVWQIHSGEFEFINRQWKVFPSIEEADRYADEEQLRLNGGVSAEERAWDGWCYTLSSIRPVIQIDGYRVVLEEYQ